MAYTHIANIGTAQSSFTIANPANIQTLDNIIMFCDDIEIANYTAGDDIVKLVSNTMYPASSMIIPVCVTDSGVTAIEPLTIADTGELSLQSSHTLATVHLNGICFHANSQYYTPAIGNIYNNGTSPLSAR